MVKIAKAFLMMVGIVESHKYNYKSDYLIPGQGMSFCRACIKQTEGFSGLLVDLKNKTRKISDLIYFLKFDD